MSYDPQADFQQGVDDFDAEYFRMFGRYPEESPLYGTSPRNDRRRAAIVALVERGATEGERAAARTALERLDRAAREARDEDDYMDARAHGEA